MPAYPAILTPDEGTVMVTFPDFPEAVTSGADETDALIQAADCLEEVVAARIKDREDIPTPGRLAAGQRLVPLASGTAAKVLVYATMRECDLRKADLGRLLGWNQKQVDRLLDPRHASRTDQIDAALLAMGRRLEMAVVSVKDARA
ncbi:MAG: type II toxin-antitoxin system HicB family antitoxin [Alphaproteobacteria bacterium]|nr:type II toxin-antitoxin system HicB family antitoxin [Alphaproteobacteria bacterium]